MGIQFFSMFRLRLLLLSVCVLTVVGPTAHAQTLLVDGTTVTMGGEHRYTSIQVINGGRILVTPFNGVDRVNTGNLVLIADSILVDATSSISARGAGYQPRLCRDGAGPSGTAGGSGGCAVSDSGGGGAHFGRGGRGTIDNPDTYPADFEEDCGDGQNMSGTACASLTSCRNNDGLPSVAGSGYFHSVYDIEFGAAGGDKGCRDNDGFDQPSVGGPGGGRIVLAALTGAQTGSIIIRGTVTANGRRGCGTGNDSAGGGAGGSVLIVGDNVQVTATGRVSAAGGLGGDTGAAASGQPDFQDCPMGAQTSGTCDDCGGGGGGGIVSVLSRSSDFASAATFDVSGALGGVCSICRGEAGGGAGELQLDGAFVGELCDGYDNDFDGMVDEALPNMTCGLGTCATSSPMCVSGEPASCTPVVSADPSCSAVRDNARPRISVILDTSGSMLLDLDGYPTFGDGSVDRPGIDTNGNGQPDDSRLFLARSALASVISAYPEIDFSLARYHQDQSFERSCQLARWFECAGIIGTYDNPTNNTGAVACNVTIGTGSVSVRSTSPGDECINYAGSCGPPRRGADILSGFGTPTRDLVRWIDGRETNFQTSTTTGNVCNHLGGGDCEVRGAGPTPLAGSLEAISDYILPIRATDAQRLCRGYSVILVTDGAESCDGNPAALATTLFAQGIQVYVIAVSIRTEDRASLNAISAAGSGGLRPLATFVDDAADLVPALTDIIEGSVRTERCNGLDDNCNGEIDESFPNLGLACDDGGVGFCRGTGAFICRADGLGTQCSITAPGATPTAEICDGLDNNCNEAVDEGLQCGGTCTPTGPEICDGTDNNCNGAIDETDPEIGTTCGSNVGICRPGTNRCVAGMIRCIGGTGPRDEVCNGLDDDCDGIPDNLAVCPGNTACLEGACRRTCDPSQEFPCPSAFRCEEGGTSGGFFCVPTACALCAPEESCVDDTCIDLCANVSCDGGEQCVAGQCVDCYVLGCPSGEVCLSGVCGQDPCLGITCDDGQACVRGVCAASCSDSNCPAGQACDATGTCAATTCSGVTCGAGFACVEGQCRVNSCATTRCSPGQVCVAGQGCVANPCEGVICPANRACSVSLSGGFQCVGGDAAPQYYTTSGGLRCAVSPAKNRGAIWWLALVIALFWITKRSRGDATGPSKKNRALVLAGTLLTMVALSTGCNRDGICPDCPEAADASIETATDTLLDTATDEPIVFDAAGCDGGVETCNFMDDDCDGMVDEDFVLASDPNNCGQCGRSCRFEQAEGTCTLGQCEVGACLPGFRDLDGLPGCEYTCPVFPTTGEECNGLDDDCDSIIDEPAELPNPPPGLCRNTPGTLCASVTAACRTRVGVTTWYCNYPSSIEYDPDVPNGITGEETRCDGIDGDCDGDTDEIFPDLGNSCDNGDRGLCRDDGIIRCSASDVTETFCDLSFGTAPLPGAPFAETCNGQDDNCDGIVDNADRSDPARVRDAMHEVTSGMLHFWIYDYEAARPDGTGSLEGVGQSRSCSTAGRIPWTTVSFQQAQSACAAAGHRLCSAAEWQAACQGPMARTYPYGASYLPNVCNGADNDTVPGGSINNEVLPGGAMPMCLASSSLYDMSGNVKEWTSTQAGTSAGGQPIYFTQGGSFDSPQLGLVCSSALSQATQDTVLPSLGFRCCADVAP